MTQAIPSFVIKRASAALALIAMACAIISFGCAHPLPHPPTFADYRRLPRGVFTEARLTAQLALAKAAMFSPSDIERIRAKGNPRELVGAALQTKVGASEISALIREAFLRGSNDPVVLTGVATTLIRELANSAQAPADAPDVDQVVIVLQQLESDNGLPLCLRGYLQMKRGDTNAALISVKAAVDKPALRLHGTELRRCVIQAAITANYPRFTAFTLAIGTLGASTWISNVGRQLLNNPNIDHGTAEACLQLGRRYETQAKLFIDQLIAFSLQKRALEFLQPAGFQQELERMQHAKEKITKAITFLDSSKAHKASERRWMAYYETVFERSELEAVTQFAEVLNYKM